MKEIGLRDGGHLVLIDNWLDDEERARLLAQLQANTPWRQETITIAGKRVQQPRLTAWHGDPDAAYTYSGLKNEPLPWTNSLVELRRRVEQSTDAVFNSVLLNLYRDGNDAMGMHADNEPELGRDPTIASVSLGAARRFVVQHRRDKADRRDLDLLGGSLLLMRGTVQHHYTHGVPRQPGAGPRINLTFRKIVPIRSPAL